MTQARPVHAPIGGFSVVDDCLSVGGIALTRLAERVGSTPFYAYDRSLITRRVETLRTGLPAGIHIHYAMKANPMPAVVQHLASLVDGIDVASAGELRVALDTGIEPQSISFAGPGKSPRELRQAVAAGIVVNIESEHELDRLAQCGAELGITPRVAVRVNPDFELKSSGMKMGGGPKQFGIDAEAVPGVFARMRALGIASRGLHIFSGSQNLRAASIVEAQTKSVELAIRLAGEAPSPLTMLNIGGGFGIPYFPGDLPLDLAPIGANAELLLERVRANLGGTQLVLELGRYLVGEAGIYVCRVLDRKISRGEVFLVTDGGLHHHLAASGNFGQVLRKNYPLAIGNRMRGSAREVATITGPLCTPLDLLGDRMDVAKAEIGDLVVVFQSGAYGYTASPTAFLSHPVPVEVLV